MTNLEFWYYSQCKKKKEHFRTKMVEACGVCEKTIYSYLHNEAPKLTKIVFADYTKIHTHELYKQKQ